MQIKGSSFYCDHVECESGQLSAKQCLKQVLKLLLLVGASALQRLQRAVKF